MAALESYSPCPCGSGQKYKWCCQKVEPIAERAQRLIETGQAEASLAVLEEGLAKNPESPWLLMRRAFLYTKQTKLADAEADLRTILRKQPGHVGAHNFLIRLLLESGSADSYTSQLQDALGAVAPDQTHSLGMAAQLISMFLHEEGHTPAAIAHIRLAEALDGDVQDRQYAQALRTMEGDAAVSDWLRNPYKLAASPDNLEPASASLFAEAVAMANVGRWNTASAAFEALSGQGLPAADYNLGICRLWLADDVAAVAALRRYIPTLGDSAEAVDLEALCQILVPGKGEDFVGHVKLIWTVRDREALLKALRDDPAVDDEGQELSDPDDPNSPEVENFALLDRAKPTADLSTLGVADLPRIEARVSVSKDSAALDLVDDGRLERLSARFTEVAGSSIPPAHPRTKVLGPIARSVVAMSPTLYMPEDVSREDAVRFANAEATRVLTEVWPDLKFPFLGGKTPRQAAKVPALQVSLRATLLQVQARQSAIPGGIDFETLRKDLGIDAEPAIDPATVDLETLHIARLGTVPVKPLDDMRLVSLFVKAHRFLNLAAIEASSIEIIERPSLIDGDSIDRVIPFSDLANIAVSMDRKDEAFAWLERGRRTERFPGNAVRWDLLEVRLRARVDRPEEWVPQLAIVLERYAQDRTASPLIMSNLVEMGLVEVAPNPDDPDQVLMDTRRLQAVLSRFGPKITTASGRLGVSATQNKIWTPGDAGSSAGAPGIWTPGSGDPSPPGPDKPKLILPGR